MTKTDPKVKEAQKQWDKDRAKYRKTGKYRDLGISGVRRDFLAHPRKYIQSKNKIKKY